jgi:2-polyprenyl-3-methyl-5-hydroxy-6-metoxy-1,4-benzoquinol methylase
MTMDQATCRVCRGLLTAPAFDEAGPSLTSIRTVLDLRTQVWLCAACGHAQSPDLPDISEFYDTQYRISLDIDGHDQLYENAVGEQVFRTAYQAELLQSLSLEKGARVLDFGAGKATTLKRLATARPDIAPHVFDVSTDYVEHWADWIPSNQQATYALPQDWAGRFDLITAHFVLEHVASPVEVLTEIARCLAPGGQLFLSVPDAEGNSGDLLVVDHLNHFTGTSLAIALAKAGLVAETIDPNAFAGAFVVLAKNGTAKTYPAISIDALRAALTQWQGILSRLAQNTPEGPVAIYGAGFYGSLIASRLAGGLRCFLDRNPYLQGQSHFGVPVLPPEDCPADVKDVIAGLNPARARAILADAEEWLPENARLTYLDEA